MSKIKLNTSLKTCEEETSFQTLGVIIDNKITYKEEDVMVTLLQFDNKILLTRRSEDYTIDFDFQLNKKTKGVYNIKKLNYQIPLEIKTVELKNSNNNIIIKYLLKMNNEEIDLFKFKLVYEVIK